MWREWAWYPPPSPSYRGQHFPLRKNNRLDFLTQTFHFQVCLGFFAHKYYNNSKSEIPALANKRKARKTKHLSLTHPFLSCLVFTVRFSGYIIVGMITINLLLTGTRHAVVQLYLNHFICYWHRNELLSEYSVYDVISHVSARSTSLPQVPRLYFVLRRHRHQPCKKDPGGHWKTRH